MREVRDEDLPLLFEQWADPVAAHMADLVVVALLPERRRRRCWQVRRILELEDPPFAQRALSRSGFNLKAP